ncbi:MAG: NUDIX hydrolase [Chloroflexi bacterium]|nr:NUDIX hydrolase [Chloroflexota bacterium]
MGPWRRRTRRIAYENPWLRVYHDEVDRPDGSPGIYGVVHFRNTAVVVVAIDGQDRVALVAQHRYTLDERSWELPAGGVPRDEDPLAGAQRELREEAGVEATTWQALGRMHLSNSVTDEVAMLYLATDLRHGEAELEASEADLSLEWIPFDEVIERVMDGRISDALSVIALQRVALSRLTAGSATR